MIIAETGRSVSYRELDERSSQLAWLLDRRAVGRDATVAVIAENVAEWAEVIWGANRSGRYVAPVNWHVSPQEMAELLIACQATVVVTTSAQLPSVQAALTSVPGIALALVVGDGGSALPPGLEWYEAALAGQPTTPVAGEQLGGRVMFSSGTTGQPKVIRHPGPGVHPLQAPPHLGRYTGLFRLDSGTVYLSPAPTYHTSPYRFVVAVLQLGGTVVCLQRFDPADALAAIGRYSVTHAQFVPTMFVRMLRLPEPVRRDADLSTLRVAITGAARCSAELKGQVMDWWGPVVHELYGASESYGNCHIGPQDAVTHPGSVGRALIGTIHITGEDGRELAAGQQGQV
jgi:acyl-CoA synthetase (AMP-forming)/AMP-acid ligase II